MTPDSETEYSETVAAFMKEIEDRAKTDHPVLVDITVEEVSPEDIRPGDVFSTVPGADEQLMPDKLRAADMDVIDAHVCLRPIPPAALNMMRVNGRRAYRLTVTPKEQSDASGQ